MRIGYVYLPSDKEYDRFDSKVIDVIFANLGHNSGNLLFLNAGLTFLSPASINTIVNVNVIQKHEDFDVIIFMFANLIGVHTGENYINKLTQILSNTNCKCITMGLGSQIEYSVFEKNPNMFNPKLVALLKMLSERCRNIFVRDINTKQVLSKMCVNNTIVTGCPSILLNNNSRLGDIIEEKITRLKNNPHEILATVNYQSSEHTDPFTQKIIKLAKKYEYPIIIQDDLTTLNKLYVDSSKYMPLIDQEFTPLEFKTRFRFFYKITPWLSYLKDFNLCIGARIHGAIINIISENVGINICHDVRTRGLCQTLCIPYIDVQDFMKLKDDLNISHILSLIQFNKAEFNKARLYAAKSYLEEFEFLKVPVSDHLKDMVQQTVSVKNIPLLPC